MPRPANAGRALARLSCSRSRADHSGPGTEEDLATTSSCGHIRQYPYIQGYISVICSFHTFSCYHPQPSTGCAKPPIPCPVSTPARCSRPFRSLIYNASPPLSTGEFFSCGHVVNASAQPRWRGASQSARGDEVRNPMHLQRVASAHGRSYSPELRYHRRPMEPARSAAIYMLGRARRRSTPWYSSRPRPHGARPRTSHEWTTDNPHVCNRVRAPGSLTHWRGVRRLGDPRTLSCILAL